MVALWVPECFAAVDRSQENIERLKVRQSATNHLPYKSASLINSPVTSRLRRLSEVAPDFNILESGLHECCPNYTFSVDCPQASV